MKHETGKAHIFGNNRHIQATKDKPKPFSVPCLDACLGAFDEEALKAFVFEGADHLTSVTRNAPRYKTPNVPIERLASGKLSEGSPS